VRSRARQSNSRAQNAKKTVPAELRKIPAQCGDIGVVADAVELFEYEGSILALLAGCGIRISC
jgi:hypothetical protein